jgi:hypothetical protein
MAFVQNFMTADDEMTENKNFNTTGNRAQN